MIIFLYSIAAAAVLIYVPFLVVAYACVRIGYEVSAPRTMFDKLPSYTQQPPWRHQKAFEAFMVFVAAAFMAYVTGVNYSTAATIAIAFVAAHFFTLFFIL